MTYYVGVLDGSGGVWGVRIPDIPGCVGGGATAEEAIADAAGALRDVLAHKREGGFGAPRPSTLSAIVASGEIGEGESAVMIPLLLELGPNGAGQHQPRRRPARRDRRRRQGARPQPIRLPRQRGAGQDHGGSVGSGPADVATGPARADPPLRPISPAPSGWRKRSCKRAKVRPSSPASIDSTFSLRAQTGGFDVIVRKRRASG